MQLIKLASCFSSLYRVMINFNKAMFMLVLCMFLTTQSQAQYDVSNLDLDKDVSRWFDQQIGFDQTQLVAGVYHPQYYSPNSHPFFLEKVWITGTLKYRNQVFREVDMIYNIYEDYLVIKHPTNFNLASQPIKLEAEKIEWFSLKGYQFVNFQNLKKKSGLYNMLYQGSKVILVSKRAKKEVIERSNDPVGYKKDDSFYLIKNNEPFLVKNKSGFIKVYPALKNEIKEFVKSNKLLVNTKNETGLVELAEFCNAQMYQQ